MRQFTSGLCSLSSIDIEADTRFVRVGGCHMEGPKSEARRNNVRRWFGEVRHMCEETTGGVALPHALSARNTMERHITARDRVARRQGFRSASRLDHATQRRRACRGALGSVMTGPAGAAAVAARPSSDFMPVVQPSIGAMRDEPPAIRAGGVSFITRDMVKRGQVGRVVKADSHVRYT